jgi:hypothetical protein
MGQDLPVRQQPAHEKYSSKLTKKPFGLYGAKVPTAAVSASRVSTD